MPPRPRKKACTACSDAKTRCDHKAPCTRCQVREIDCRYPHRQAVPNGGPTIQQSNVDELPASSQHHRRHRLDADLPPVDQHNREYCESHARDVSNNYELDSHRLGSQPSRPSLLCTVNAPRIQNRWLRAFLLEPGEQEKHPPPGLQMYYFRMLKAWSAMAITSSGTPPFIHALQLQGLSWCSPLTNCFSLLRVLDTRLPGSEGLSRTLLVREMKKLYDEHTSYDALVLLAAFQAYLLYSMAIFFHLSNDDNDGLRQAIVNLQQLACATSLHGVITPGELQHFRPDWQSWIVAETKRRSLYTMYMFDNLLCAKDSIPVYLGTELSGLPAPASRMLWRPSTEVEWQAAYNVHLSVWQETNMTIDDLWPVLPTLGTSEIAARTARVDRWLEGVDEFGTMLYAVTYCTHGG